MIVSMLVARHHDPDQAMEASQMANVELWMRPDLFDPCRTAGNSSVEDRLFAWLCRRASWRACDLRRRSRREAPSQDLVGCGAELQRRGAVTDDPADLLLEPDDPFWMAMNATQRRHGTSCHPEALACCLAGEPQRAVAEKFSTSAATLNRQLAFFKARFALLGRPGHPTYDVPLVRALRRRGLELVVVLRHEVEADESLHPRVPCGDEEHATAWICEVAHPADGGA